MNENKSPGARDEAKKFLLAILANRPVAKTEIEKAAKAEGIAKRTLYRAKRELKNIIAKKDAAHGGWTWRLCDDEESKKKRATTCRAQCEVRSEFRRALERAASCATKRAGRRSRRSCRADRRLRRDPAPLPT